jgi:hypothetical protein
MDQKLDDSLLSTPGIKRTPDVKLQLLLVLANFNGEESHHQTDSFHREEALPCGASSCRKQFLSEEGVRLLGFTPFPSRESP